MSGSSANLGRGMEKEREAAEAWVMGEGVLKGSGAVAAGADFWVRRGGLARRIMLMLLSTASLDFCLSSWLGSKSAPGASEAVEVIADPAGMRSSWGLGLGSRLEVEIFDKTAGYGCVLRVEWSKFDCC